MKVQLISANVLSHPYTNNGIKDRRFKTGYRVLPYACNNNEIILIIQHDGSVRIQEVFMTYLGKMIAVSIDRHNNIATLKQVSTGDLKANTTIYTSMEIASIGVPYREGL